MNLTTSSLPMSSHSSLLYLIRHTPLSTTGPHIFLSTFLSNLLRAFSSAAVSVHVSAPYYHTTCLINVLYICNLDLQGQLKEKISVLSACLCRIRNTSCCFLWLRYVISVDSRTHTRVVLWPCKHVPLPWLPYIYTNITDSVTVRPVDHPLDVEDHVSLVQLETCSCTLTSLLCSHPFSW
jgi:hypothetical protein